MVQREVIELKQYTSGTTITKFFGFDDPAFSGMSIGYAMLDTFGNITNLSKDKFGVNFVRNLDNTFSDANPLKVPTKSPETFRPNFDSALTSDSIGRPPLTEEFGVSVKVGDGLINSDSVDRGNINNEPPKFISGRTTSDSINYTLTDEQKGIISSRFVSETKSVYGEDKKVFMDFSPYSPEDLYANIEIVKTYNTLNTLSVINSVQGENNVLEATTGVVFGKLESIQKINDSDGNKLRVPLANVPVCIFNPTEEFPDISSQDNEGNRMVLNLKENSPRSLYFNDESFSFGQNFLQTTESLKSIPGRYRYSALTNERGEFIIYDVPVGSQTFMLEVDLLKQGLTKDEVALNMFPYPTVENPNVDTVPHFYSRQFNINVIPSWGDFQSGYTQLNINVPVDLRKWATYLFPPVSFANEKLEVTVAKNQTRKLKIQIRDMTIPNFPFKTLTMVKVGDDLDREGGSDFVWYNEFAENRQQVEFNEFKYYIIKLPANLYDPNGFKTDCNGVKTDSKGVWLAAYQFKEFIDKNLATRTTGGYFYWNNRNYLISHFDLNYVAGNDIDHKTSFPDSKIGIAPYDKPWTINYPEPYSIPQKPKEIRINTAADRRVYSPGVYFLEEPIYADGDLIGMPFGGLPSGGFGVQYIPDNAGDGPGVFFPSRFASVVTKDYVYKYEANVAWTETYSNGFMPVFNQPSDGIPFGGLSKVIGGEKYQRVECGYGYFMLPQGWPRYFRHPDGGDIPSADLLGRTPHVEEPGVRNGMYAYNRWFVNTWNLDEGQNLSLALGPTNQIAHGMLNLYRVVRSGKPNETEGQELDGNTIKPQNFVIPTYARLKINRSRYAFSFSLTNNGEKEVRMKNRFGGGVFFYDKNDNVQYVGQFEMFTLYPGKIVFMRGAITGADNTYAGNVSQVLYGVNITLPGNANYDPDSNRYTRAKYNFRVTYIPGDTGSRDFNFDEEATTGLPTWWVRTLTNGSSEGVVQDGIARDFNYGGNSYDDDKKNIIVRMFYEQYGDELSEYHGYFLPNENSRA
jgi:hypothetical protein